MQSWQMAGPAAWEQRLKPLTTVVPYLILAALALLTVALRGDNPALAVDLTLCAAAALWNLVFFTIHPPWRERRDLMQIFLAGLILFGLIMVIRVPWFGFYTPALYFYAYRIIGWPRELYFITGAAVVAGTAQATGLELDTWIGLLSRTAVVLANVIPMCLLAWINQIGDRYYSRLTAAQQENERLAREAGILDERARLAREIHDTIAQGLTGIITQLQAASQVAPPTLAAPASPTAATAAGSDDWRRHHDAAIALARESLTEARRSVNELRPEPLETGRLADAITQVATTWSARQRIPTQVTVTGDTRTLRPEAEVALLRTAQEALANVARHAGPATRVGLTLSYMDNQTALDVRDDGQGFDTSRTSGGFGLEAMRQRIEALDGTLQIESEIDGGTGISACLPHPDGPPHPNGLPHPNAEETP
jgi:signal transduction histidine kinase